MATAAIAGYDGSISGPTGVSEVKEFTINLNMEQLEATSFSSSGWREYVQGLQGADGSFSCFGTAIPSRGLSAGTFKTKSTGGATISGSILISKVGVPTPVDGVVMYSCDFVFTGSVTVA